ncbi:MAG: hypothetical protein ACO1OD_00065 [Croceibacterium sp.]
MPLSPEEWWSFDLPPSIDVMKPGIYEWRIGQFAVYVGKSKRLRSRIREYPNNVQKLINEAPYRLTNPDGFGEIHRYLHEASLQGYRATVTVLENCEEPELNARERYWIELRRKEARDGGPRVLNGDRGRLIR